MTFKPLTLEQWLQILEISSAELARRSGVSAATISRLINGKNRPTVFTLISISRAIGVSVDDIAI